MRRSVSYGLAAAVVAAALSGGVVAWAAADKSVTISVDGQAKHLHTTAGTVAGALADAGLKVGAHDVVAPASAAKIRDGSHIVLRHGRLLHLTVDGVERDLWVTDPTVGQALADLGYGQARLESTSRDTRLPLTGSAVTIAAAKQVTITHDGTISELISTAPTVGDLLASAGIALATTDTISPAISTPLSADLVVVIHRVTTANVTKSLSLAFATTQQSDASLARGTSIVVSPGAKGTVSIVYLVTYIDGVAVHQTQVSKTVAKAPKARVVKVGTKVVVITSSPAPPASTSGLNWDGVAQCESGGHWNDNTGNGYYGGLQFLVSTWLSNGGGVYAARPDLATKAQQIAIANKLYAARGSAPWPVCGRYL